MKPKIFRITAILILLSMVLAACSTPAAQTQAPSQPEQTQAPAAPEPTTPPEAPQAPAQPAGPTGEITFIAPIDTPGFFPAMGQKFMEKFPGSKVNVVEESWDNIHDKLATEFAAQGATYDVAMVPVDMLPAFTSAGWITPLTDAQVTEIKDDNISLNIAYVDGKYWGAPLTAYPQLMDYNKLILDKAGVQPPKTWAEFTEACKKIQASGEKYCMLIALKAGRYASNRFEVLNYAFGGKVMDDNNEFVFDTDPQTIKAVQWIADGLLKDKFIDPASLVTDDFEADSAFAQGRYAFHISSAWGFFQADHNPEMSTIMGNAHVMLMPTDDGKGGGTLSYGAALAMPTNAKNKELAWEFIKFMVGEEGQKAQLFDTGNLPVYGKYFTAEDVVAKITDIKIMGEQIKLGTSKLPYSWEPEYERMIVTYLHKAWLGELTVEDALKQAADEVRKMVASY